MQSVIKTTFALLFCVVLVTPLPNPDQMEAMEIYQKCRDHFGTQPRVACRSSSECRLASTKCPEHDCLPNRSGKSFCTWQVY